VNAGRQFLIGYYSIRSGAVLLILPRTLTRTFTKDCQPAHPAPEVESDYQSLDGLIRDAADESRSIRLVHRDALARRGCYHHRCGELVASDGTRTGWEENRKTRKFGYGGSAQELVAILPRYD